MTKEPIDILLNILVWPLYLTQKLSKLPRFILNLIFMFIWFPIGAITFLITSPFFLLWELWIIEEN